MTNNKGTTLLEVIVAVVILGIMTTMSMDSFSVARKSNFLANRYMQADDLSTTILEEAHNIDFDDFTSRSDEEGSSDAYEDYMNSTYYDTSSQYCKLKLPSIYTVDEKWTKNNSLSTSDKIVLDLNNISGKRVKLNARLTLDVTEYKDDYNQAQFPELDTITESNTAIIDAIGSTAVYERDSGTYVPAYTSSETLKYFLNNHNNNSYDNRAVREFKARNERYIKQKYDECCELIQEYNEEEDMDLPIPVLEEDGSFDSPFDIYDGYRYATEEEIKKHIKKTSKVTISNNDLFTYLNAEVIYELKQNVGGSWEALIEDEPLSSDDYNKNREVSYPVVNSTKFLKLSNLYYMYVPLSEDYTRDNVWGTNVDNLIINNGIYVDDSTDINLYIIGQAVNSDGEDISYVLIDGEEMYTPPNTEIKVVDVDNVTTIMYTNLRYTNAFAATNHIEVQNLHSEKTHLLEEKYSRLFSTKVEIRDATTNALYSIKESNILR